MLVLYLFRCDRLRLILFFSASDLKSELLTVDCVYFCSLLRVKCNHWSRACFAKSIEWIARRWCYRRGLSIYVFSITECAAVIIASELERKLGFERHVLFRSQIFLTRYYFLCHFCQVIAKSFTVLCCLQFFTRNWRVLEKCDCSRSIFPSRVHRNVSVN